MKKEDITALILAWNEEDNLERTLRPLAGLRRVLVVDSGSSDRTREICAGFANVDVIENPFLDLARQANFGLGLIDSPWVLSLDADYRMPDGWLEGWDLPSDNFDGFLAPFVYEVGGRPLRGSLYPPRLVLYRRAGALYQMDGHAHRVTIAGKFQRIGRLPFVIAHDDRKPLSRWLQSQSLYAAEEARKLSGTPVSQLTWPDRIRLAVVIAPWFVVLWCLLVNGCLLDGRAGWFYALQRGVAEGILSMRLLEMKLRNSPLSAP